MIYNAELSFKVNEKTTDFNFFFIFSYLFGHTQSSYWQGENPTF